MHYRARHRRLLNPDSFTTERKPPGNYPSASGLLIIWLAAQTFDTRRIGKKVLITHASLVRYAEGDHYAAVSASTAERRSASSACA